MTIAAKLKSKSAMSDDGCRIWTGGKNTRGYGHLWVNGRYSQAHRLSLELKLGRPISAGMYACHTCNTPTCINPDHLYEGTPTQNADDRRAAGANPNGARNGSCKLTEIQVVAIRSSTETERALAAHYGVSRALVGDIRRGKKWRHLL